MYREACLFCLLVTASAWHKLIWRASRIVLQQKHAQKPETCWNVGAVKSWAVMGFERHTMHYYFANWSSKTVGGLHEKSEQWCRLVAAIDGNTRTPKTVTQTQLNAAGSMHSLPHREDWHTLWPWCNREIVPSNTQFWRGGDYFGSLCSSRNSLKHETMKIKTLPKVLPA